MLSLADIRNALSQLGSPFLSAIKNFLPSELRFQGRIYRRSSIQNAEQLGWYVAALGIAAPQSVAAAVAAAKRAAGMPYDAQAAFECDCMEPTEYDAYGIDPATLAIVVALIGTILKNAPALISFLQGPPSAPISSGGTGGNTEQDGASDDEDKTDSKPLLLIGALFLLAQS